MKLAKKIRDSPDTLLAEVNKKLRSTVTQNLSKNNSLIFTTKTPKPSTSHSFKEDNKVPDSNELFRKFLQFDRKRSFSVPKKITTRSNSVPNMSSVTSTRHTSPTDKIDTIPEQVDLPASSRIGDGLKTPEVQSIACSDGVGVTPDTVGVTPDTVGGTPDTVGGTPDTVGGTQIPNGTNTFNNASNDTSVLSSPTTNNDNAIIAPAADITDTIDFVTDTAAAEYCVATATEAVKASIATEAAAGATVVEAGGAGASVAGGSNTPCVGIVNVKPRALRYTQHQLPSQQEQEHPPSVSQVSGDNSEVLFFGDLFSL